MKKNAHNRTSAARAFAFVEGQTERAIFLALMACIGLSFAFYLSFVGMTIVNIVERNDLDKENRSLSSSVSELELAYLSETERVDMALAYEKGFTEAGNPVFAGTAARGNALALKSR